MDWSWYPSGTDLCFPLFLTTSLYRPPPPYQTTTVSRACLRERPFERWLQPPPPLPPPSPSQETDVGTEPENSTGELPEGFLLVFIKVNSYLGALLFTQVAESFFKSDGGGEVRKLHVSLWVIVKVAHRVTAYFTVECLVEVRVVYKTKPGLAVLTVQITIYRLALAGIWSVSVKRR